MHYTSYHYKQRYYSFNAKIFSCPKKQRIKKDPFNRNKLQITLGLRNRVNDTYIMKDNLPRIL